MRLEKSFVQKDNNVDVVQLEVLFYEDIQSIYKKNITPEVKPFLMILILMHNSFFQNISGIYFKDFKIHVPRKKLFKIEISNCYHLFIVYYL